MTRITRKTPNGIAVEDVAAALERLAAYEDMRERLLAEEAELERQLAPLRGCGRPKTARHRELMGRRLQLVYVLGLFRAEGLLEE